MLIQPTFITGNQHKAEQLSKYLGLAVSHQKVDLTEIQSLDLIEVVKHKVIEAYSIVKTPVIVDDVSLKINALGRLPGPFIKFFLEELGADGLCQLVSNYEDKTAIATVAIGYYDGQDLKIFTGEVIGQISISPQGERGFGFDRIMIPEGYTQTRGEMSEADFDLTSHRRKALEQLADYLKSVK